MLNENSQESKEIEELIRQAIINETPISIKFADDPDLFHLYRRVWSSLRKEFREKGMSDIYWKFGSQSDFDEII